MWTVIIVGLIVAMGLIGLGLGVDEIYRDGSWRKWFGRGIKSPSRRATDKKIDP